MIVVTGGAGFIGSNLIKKLNEHGKRNILVVDDLTLGKKCRNLADCDFIDYIDRDEWLQCIVTKKRRPKIDAVFHQGACSDTTEWNGRYLMETNYAYSKYLLHDCLEQKIPFFYASSASVYGNGSVFIESRSYENPLNMYAFSKFQFDQYVRSLGTLSSQVVGLRYFNVYGPREAHKGNMASIIFHLNTQLKNKEKIKLFGAHDGYAAGEQKRDFIYVDDVVAINLWFLDHPTVSGIFNIGTGCAQSFNDVAHAIITTHGHGEIEYIPFPTHLDGAYQSYTEANIQKLRDAGYIAPFTPIQIGVNHYIRWLIEQPH
jgi:ADP-L-glycero-D-manno-heptose 6-epimerase